MQETALIINLISIDRRSAENISRYNNNKKKNLKIEDRVASIVQVM